MELTLETYRNIVKNVGSRPDLASLCRVSRGFRQVSERSLYNTLFLRNDITSHILCKTLTTSHHLAALVDTLTVLLEGDGDDESDGYSEASDAYEEEDDSEPPKVVGYSTSEEFWTSIASVLSYTISLRYLNIHINDRSTCSVSWILQDCGFQLRQFHCDATWDAELVNFLSRQRALRDLYILDFSPDTNASETHSSENPERPTLALHAASMPNLSVLECTFSEAATTLVPGRPITHLKTCFSCTDSHEKRNEMYDLVSKVTLSTRRLRSLDIGDSSFTERFSTEFLAAMANTRPLTSDLRYLGTLVLPVDGHERLHFYGLLRRFPKLQCVELEVSDWRSPSQPTSFPGPAALRSLAGELRLYIPSINQAVFVNNFNRSVVTLKGSSWKLDDEFSVEMIWREI